MKKKVLFIISFFIFCNLFSQNQDFTGKVLDGKTKEALEMAQVRVLKAKDSMFVTGTVTDEEGAFTLPLKPAKYIIQVSLLGYKDHFINTTKATSPAFGDILLKENSVLLNEAVVEAKAIEIQVKGDTVEYNADSYKVQESAVVEDLLKKMPGVEIDENGKITVNGKEVKKFLVDGKEFFSDDPKVASKNLPASMVNKLQVLDRKSDMSLMTGFDDGSEETVINLTIKPGMKEGVFGNAYAGIGTEEKYEANGMINYMRNNKQMSFVGGANNTNNAGFTDFASSMGGGNRPRGINFGGNNGISKAINGGFNFATDYGTKFKWGGNIRYGSNDNDITSTTYKKYTQNDRIQNSKTTGNNFGQNFNTSFRFEWKPDSATNIIFSPTVQYNKNSNTQDGTSDNYVDGSPSDITNTKGITHYESDDNKLKFSGNLDISRRLNTKGRVVSFSLSGGVDNSDGDGFNYSRTDYLNVAGKNRLIDQKFEQNDKNYNWRGFVSFVEPIGRNNYLQLTYNLSNRNSETDKTTYKRYSITDNYTSLDSLYTRNVKNDFINQNISLNFKAVRKNYNYTVGIGIEPSSSKTDITFPNNQENNNPRRHFLNFAPNGQFNYIWDKRHNLRIDYKGTTTQPTTMQLFEGVISRNETDSTVGNPNLRPGFENRLSVRYQKFNPEKGSMMMLFGRFTHTMNDITTTSNWTGNIREITYDNINGNMNGQMRFVYNTPLKNKKLSFNTMTFGRYEQSNTYFDTQKNRADIAMIQENIGLQFRSDKFDFNVRGNVSFNNIVNTVNNKNDRSVYNYGSYGSFTYYLPYGFTLDSDLQYSANSGYGEGYKQDEWLWNASLAKTVGKSKQGTIRVKMYDILQQRSNISQLSANDYTGFNSSNTIKSYAMLHFIYKFQIFKGGVKRTDMDGAESGFGGHGRGMGGGEGRGRF